MVALVFGVALGADITSWGLGYPVPVLGVSAAEAQPGVIRRFGHGETQFNLGVSSLAPGPDGRLWACGLQWSAGEDYGRVLSTVFSVLPDGTDFRPAFRVTRPGDTQPLRVATTQEGAVFAHAPGIPGPMYRYQPGTGQLTDLRTNTPAVSVVLNSTLRQLGDGWLYATTTNGLFRLHESGRTFQNTDLRGTGLRGFASGVVEDTAGWLYLVAQRGGADDGGGVVRCRSDGSDATRWTEFGFEGASDKELSSQKSGLCVTHEGNILGLLHALPRGALLYRLGSDGRHQVIGALAGTNSFVFVPGGLTEDRHGLLWARTRSEGWLQISPSGKSTTESVSPALLGTGSFVWRRPGGQSLGVVNEGSPDWIRINDGRLFTASGYGIVTLNPDSADLRPVRHWGPTGGDGQTPAGPLIPDGRGNLVGVALGGGLINAGVVYSTREDGSGGAVLHAFTGATGDVLNPSGFITLSQDGWLYGTSQQGSTGDFTPKLFRLHAESGDFEVLATLPGRFDRPDQPRCGLMQASDGRLYGTTPRGGAADLGTLFRYDPAGQKLTIVHEFGGQLGDRWQARPELLESRDGFLYGLGESREAGHIGSDGLFRIRRDGTGYQVRDYLPKRDTGLRLSGGLTEAQDGHLYTVRACVLPVAANVRVLGQIIRLARPSGPDGMFRSEIVFESRPEAEPSFIPLGSLVETADGWLVGQGYRQWHNSRTFSVCRWHPTTGAFERIAIGGGSLPVSAEQLTEFVPPYLLSSEECVFAFGAPSDGGTGGSLRRLSLRRPAAPTALPEPQLVTTYGHYLSLSFSPPAFTKAVETSAVLVDDTLFAPRSSVSIEGITATPLRLGSHRIGLVASDGLFPPILVTNWLNLTVNRAPLQAQGQRWVRAVGNQGWKPTGRLVGVKNQDRITADWTTTATYGSQAGEYPVLPTLHDPDNRLGNYEYSIVPGAIRLVDPIVRVESSEEGVRLNLPGVPGLHIFVDESPVLSPPNWSRTDSFTVTSETPPPLRLRAAPDRGVQFFRVTVE